MSFKIFRIEWPDEFGPGWMCKEKLESIMKTKNCIGPTIVNKIKVSEIKKEDACK